MQRASRFVVPQDPLFSPSALVLRSGLQENRGAVYLDFFWARNAIFHGLGALGIEAGQKVLVPAYLCKAAIEPIEHFGAEVGFYAIRRNCEPDWADFESKIHGVRAAMAVHYFGIPCDIERFRAICRRYGVFLIEDCAHVLDGIPNQYRLGEFGDFSIFSPRKYLPIFDGGRLRLSEGTRNFEVRTQFESPVFTARAAKNLFDRRRAPAGLPEAKLPLNPGGGEGDGGASGGLDFGRPRKPRYVFPNELSFLPWMVNFPMSRLSRCLLPHFPLLDIASKRRANYQWLVEKLAGLKEVRPVCRQLAGDVVPWVLPVTVGETNDAHKSLRTLGIPAVTWGEVRDQRISASEFPDADFLYEHLIFLPVHQDLESGHLEVIAEAVASVCHAGPLNLPNLRS